MIPVKHRFAGHGSLRYVYKNGQQTRNRYMVVKYVQNPRRKYSRLSVVVSKKTHKSAVGRNRIRRRVYEILRHELPNFRDGVFDVVVIVLSAEVRALPAVDLYRSIKILLAQADLVGVSQPNISDK